MLFSAEAMVGLVPLKIPVGAPLWPFKHDLTQLHTLETGDPYTFSSQMQQNPSPAGGGMFKDRYWKYYEAVPVGMDMIRIYGDTAQKTKEHNDYSVFQCWGRVPNQGVYLLDQIRGKWEAPELESKLVEFWNKWKPSLRKPFGATVVKIEDKSSGSSLIQSIKKNYMIPVEPIQRNTDKVFRAMGVVKYFASGYINLPLDVDWMSDYKEEFRKFTPLMTHKHDDQIDPTMDAVEDLIVFEDMLYSSNSIGT